MPTRITTKIVVGDKEYSSVEDMPPDVRRVYDKAMSALSDQDRNGVPDILEGKASAIGEVAKQALKGLANGTAKVTITTNLTTTRVIGSAGGTATDATLSGNVRAIQSSETSKVSNWVALLLAAAAILFILRDLGILP